ncbi:MULTISPECIES: aldehyde ferredoxin oxidoreductase C-terminal domain-containing protein [unclassified Pseudodesulfovibrio]|uniref:aldehyde ferredoxin oxidoreductase C-terminal domain-containing protein n=1 Tax=unclassified Pseudodesulfovibrio TaxID=2661612 RepID=UPI000FEC1D7F|nr:MULTISPECIES: aldehyde ferredoxin oxidoreductase C-terminal domain-containing protein [unclassified Pseudodesulfovibrio]MCJ2165603.1 aldehyde ferredoxin oxidoreductase [Pseudodesulfovibrio sp. S3-i]RWU03011.1 aldehyde ferredoxin oxidoreductase [Pseudodesulfovibrio sp. S3]
MIRDFFRVMEVNLTTGKTNIIELPGRGEYLGGAGLAARLFEKFGFIDRDWDDPEQPVIFAIGPLTGYFPLMSKTCCAFRSPYHNQYTESYAGGKSALSLRFANLDALVVTGKAKRLTALCVGSRRVETRDVEYMRGFDAIHTGRVLRKIFPGSGRRSILRIGPAGENLSAYACINVDTFRHFGRLGGGTAMGIKNLKAICILGDRGFDLPEGKAYPKLYKHIFEQLTTTEMMAKYHGLGTAVNINPLNELKSLPWKNLQQTSSPNAGGISGETFADDTLLRNAACAGCPVGCIHVGFVREQFQTNNQYLYRQVGYDYEPIFSCGGMLEVTDAPQVLRILDVIEKEGLDCMSTGVALAWATEALEKGVISEKETEVKLTWGDAETYMQAVERLGRPTNDFYKLLAQGTLKCAEHYGGADFACVLGQEMAGYATGEVFFVSEGLGFRHSHLDSGGYAYDQKHEDKDVTKALDFLVNDERERIVLNCMVGCLFSRGVYKDDLLAEALESVGYGVHNESVADIGHRVQKLRWRLRLRMGYRPDQAKIPKRYSEITTWKGPLDTEYMEALRTGYAARILEMGAPLEEDD